MKPKRKSPRLLVLTGDHHCGSTVGLMPPDFKTLAGQIIQHNPFQEWLWACWERAWSDFGRLADGDPFGLVLMGDHVEGNHHHTKEITSPEDSDHFKAAKEILRPIASRAAATFVVEGTECHTHNMEAALGEAIKARVNPNTGNHVFGRLALDVCGVRLVARHHISTTARPYLEASALSIALGVERIECMRRGEPPPRILASAHRHKQGIFQDGEAISLVTHAWQGLTRYGRKVVPAGGSTPGLYVLDWRDLPDGSLPRITAYEYQAAAPQAVAL
jgi:hypothetical protein